MYHILLLYEQQKASCRIKDYLQLSGCIVEEKVIEGVEECLTGLENTNLILIACNEVELSYRVCEILREYSQIPIIVLSESNEEWDKIRLFQAGIDDYLVVPYMQGELNARIQAHVERYKRLTRPFGLIEIHGLEIDAFSRRVKKDGREITLRLKEFDILLFMAQHPNQVLTKQEIYDAVWHDESLDGIFNSVTVHIKRIREKIEEDVDNPQFIETIWGLGYRFRG